MKWDKEEGGDYKLVLLIPQHLPQLTTKLLTSKFEIYHVRSFVIGDGSPPQAFPPPPTSLFRSLVPRPPVFAPRALTLSPTFS